MSLADKLNALIADIEAIRAAINEKGVTVAAGDPLSGFAAKIAAIKSGSGLAVSIPNIDMTCVLTVLQNFSNSSTLQVTPPDPVLVTNVATGTHIDAPIAITTTPPTVSLTTLVEAQ